MKLIVAGGREFTNRAVCFAYIRAYLKWFNEPIEIVSGMAAGADRLGELYAKDNNIPVALFPANWEQLGLKAGPIRNAEMASYATHLIAFWDGKSRGTHNMILEAHAKKLHIAVCFYNESQQITHTKTYNPSNDKMPWEDQHQPS